MGTIVWLGSEVMFFAALFAMYFSLRANSPEITAGRLHPKKQGRCRRLEKHPLDLRLPEAFWWGWGSRPPEPNGGAIERDQGPHKTPCPFFELPPREGNK